MTVSDVIEQEGLLEAATAMGTRLRPELLMPLTISDRILEEGLASLERALVAVQA